MYGNNTGELQPLSDPIEITLVIAVLIGVIATALFRVGRRQELVDFLKHYQRKTQTPTEIPSVLGAYVERTSVLPASATYVASNTMANTPPKPVVYHEYPKPAEPEPLPPAEEAAEEVALQPHDRATDVATQNMRAREVKMAVLSSGSEDKNTAPAAAYSFRNMIIAKEILDAPVSRRVQNRYGAIR